MQACEVCLQVVGVALPQFAECLFWLAGAAPRAPAGAILQENSGALGVVGVLKKRLRASGGRFPGRAGARRVYQAVALSGA